MDYDAFISYSHASDRGLSKALEASLQRFGKPVFRVRGLSVFRDQSDLTLSPHLWGRIQEALNRSGAFLLLASPESAASPWVEKEVRAWIEGNGVERLYILWTAGGLAWDETANDFDWTHTDCLPPALKGAFQGEPLYLDLRWARDPGQRESQNDRFTERVAQVVGALKGKAVEEVYGEELRRHRKTIRLRNGAILGLTALAAVSLIAAGIAANQTREANSAREREAGLNRDLQEQVRQTREERDRANAAAEAERRARLAADAQLQFVSGILQRELDMESLSGVGDQFFPLLTVYYGFQESQVPANGRASLERIAALLRSNPQIRVMVEGHFAEFDAEGRPPAAEYALGLGQRRAAGIQQFLVSRGVAAGRISITSRGSQSPRISATNPEERVNELLRAINSRAEVYAWITG